MMKPIRKSVPTMGVHHWWNAGWSYVMPDFDHPGNSIIEWIADSAPVELNRVPETQTESADDGRTATGS